MKLVSKIIFGIIVAVFISGCSTHLSPIIDTTNKGVLYPIENETDVFNTAKSSFDEIFANHPSVELTGKTRGYTVNRIVLVDQYTTTLRIFPATGLDENKQEIFGYYPDVRGDGTLFDGPVNDKKLFKSITEKFTKLAKPINVSEVKLSEYKKTPQNGSISERLDELNKIFSKGLISEQEYKEKKESILGEL